MIKAISQSLETREEATRAHSQCNLPSSPWLTRQLLPLEVAQLRLAVLPRLVRLLPPSVGRRRLRLHALQVCAHLGPLLLSLLLYLGLSAAAGPDSNSRTRQRREDERPQTMVEQF